jgi:hypothetical protein
LNPHTLDFHSISNYGKRKGERVDGVSHVGLDPNIGIMIMDFL